MGNEMGENAGGASFGKVWISGSILETLGLRCVLGFSREIEYFIYIIFILYT